VIARAGLSIELSMLQKNLTTVLLLGSVPILIEAFVLALLGSQLFHFPLPWVFMMAFGVASISPGVVVPLLLNLLDQPAWKRSRLPPLMLAATGVDVLIATTGFGIAFASAFQHTHEHTTDFLHDSWVVRGVEEISFGLLLGLFVGAFAFVLHRYQYSEPVSTSCMFFVSSLTMGWGKANGMTGVACSSIIISWAAVANVWDKVDADLANKRLKSIWNLFKPFLFPVIGASVSLTDLPLSMFLRCAGIVLLSVSVKAMAAFFVGFLTGMDFEERLFVSGTWTGKASVQVLFLVCNNECLTHSK
jgi:Kef-type K+ transport system membrane component KefB